MRPTPALLLLLVLPAHALALTAEEIDAAAFDGDPLPPDQSALTARVQVLLDRAGISPGVIDGREGGMSTSAIAAFEERVGLPVDGALDAEVWAALGGDAAGPVTQAYTITEEDLANLVSDLPDDYSDLAELDWLGYASVAELLAERFHMDEDFLLQLNPDATFAAGEAVTVVDPGDFVDGVVARIEVRKADGRLAAFAPSGAMVANYPVAVGSDSNPSPSGSMEVVTVAPLPTYHYDPENFVQGDNTEALTLPPGPNGPVGSVWIDLSEPTYGLHGTPYPSLLFERQSHGCVRLSNWDAEELSGMVQEGTVLEFIEG